MAKNSKIGKKKRGAQNSRYKAENREKKNKDRKLLRHIAKHPEDKQATQSSIPNYRPNKKNFKDIQSYTDAIKKMMKRYRDLYSIYEGLVTKRK